MKKLLTTNKLVPPSFALVFQNDVALFFFLPKIAKDLRETFKALDANGDGFLTINELRDGIEKVRGQIKNACEIQVYWNEDNGVRRKS